jgi:MEMO1 family protein
MKVRRRCLPPGWYPGDAEQTRQAIERLSGEIPPDSLTGVAGVAPHAGWEFSGSIALAVLARIARGMDTIVIIGGHLGPADGILCAFEDAYETPLGLLSADVELLNALARKITIREDRHQDNTVEIQLPFVRYLAPDIRALGLRAAPDLSAEALGKAIAEAADALGRRVGVLGSTDLTHYGANYGFAPAGTGEAALRWVKEVNDKRLIDSLLSLDVDEALERGLKERSACSLGGALAAMGYARARGVDRGVLLRYSTSHDVHPAESFVGYAGVIYSSSRRVR